MRSPLDPRVYLTHMADHPHDQGPSAISSSQVEKLRAVLLSLTYQCPRGTYTADCPFQILKGLTHQSRQDYLARMDDPSLLALFEMPLSCRCPADPRNAAVNE